MEKEFRFSPSIFQKVEEYYSEAFTSDEIGKDLIKDITFLDVFDCLNNYRDFYATIGVTDSVVRERIFDRLANIMGVDYDVIYKRWLLNYRPALGKIDPAENLEFLESGPCQESERWIDKITDEVYNVPVEIVRHFEDKERL